MDPRITLITLGVADLPRAVRFYRDGLGWPTTYEEGGPIAFFHTAGTRLALYPFDELLADITGEAPSPHKIAGAAEACATGFTGVTFAHNVRAKEEVAAVLAQAERAGAVIVKPAQEASWGGFSGYFRDLDGYYWEVAWNPFNPLDADGFMQLEA
ncbi:MAG TPA: VOC family protein [Chthoniobacter sp.]|jgi:hypothetical protein